MLVDVWVLLSTVKVYQHGLKGRGTHIFRDFMMKVKQKSVALMTLVVTFRGKCHRTCEGQRWELWGLVGVFLHDKVLHFTDSAEDVCENKPGSVTPTGSGGTGPTTSRLLGRNPKWPTQILQLKSWGDGCGFLSLIISVFRLLSLQLFHISVKNQSVSGFLF